jgi:hypothetical protein
VEVIVPGEVDVFRPREPVLAACDIETPGKREC